MSQLEVRLAQHLTRVTGVRLERGGLRDSLERYLQMRTRELSLESEEQFVDYVLSGDQAEFERLVEVVSVPHTWFFRDPQQLAGVQEVLKRASLHKDVLNVWAPGCATGEDVYSLLMLAEGVKAKVRVTGTDISDASLERARAGRYGQFSVRAVPDMYRSGFLRKEAEYCVKPELRQRASFGRHNLLDEPLTSPGGWDVIVCRNVLIYFSASVAAACAERLVRVLGSDGRLFLGAGEMLQALPSTLAPELLDGRVVFRQRHAKDMATSVPAGNLSQKASLVSPLRPLCRALHSRSLDRPSPAHHTAARCRSDVECSPIPIWESIEPARLLHLFEGGHFAEAAQIVLAASAQAPLNAQLRMVSGVALYYARDVAHALKQLRAALLLDDSLWPAALCHGLCLETVGSSDQARQEYRHAARLLDAPDGGHRALVGPLGCLSNELLELARQKSHCATR